MPTSLLMPPSSWNAICWSLNPPGIWMSEDTTKIGADAMVNCCRCCAAGLKPGVDISSLLSFPGRLLLQGGSLGVLRDAEHDELGRLDRRDPDVDGEDPGVPVLRRVVLVVALDEERLLRGAAVERAAAPD